mmetsp:Transcript_59685/g.67894  ORF Transcript_59685/g.67894 Transcript_59685/m.67894 type:complete len:229 (+) Transcript_59685:40-726(+)
MVDQSLYSSLSDQFTSKFLREIHSAGIIPRIPWLECFSVPTLWTYKCVYIPRTCVIDNYGLIGSPYQKMWEISTKTEPLAHASIPEWKRYITRRCYPLSRLLLNCHGQYLTTDVSNKKQSREENHEVGDQNLAKDSSTQQCLMEAEKWAEDNLDQFVVVCANALIFGYFTQLKKLALKYTVEIVKNYYDELVAIIAKGLSFWKFLCKFTQKTKNPEFGMIGWFPTIKI